MVERIKTGITIIVKTREELIDIINKSAVDADLNHLDVSNVVDMRGIFANSQFNGDISGWDVSNVVDMYLMFANSQFNGDISEWDVSGVEDMSEMFSCAQFQGDISKWDVSGVKNMRWMFTKSNFQGNIGSWNTNKVENMEGIFKGSVFNDDISNWDVSGVKNMRWMFCESQFNGDISGWDVSGVKNMDGMFKESVFTGDTSKWKFNPKVNQDTMGYKKITIPKNIQTLESNKVNVMTKIIESREVGIHEATNILCKVWRIILFKHGLSGALWHTLLGKYQAKILDRGTEKGAANLKGNLTRELSKDKLSWEALMRGLDILEFDELEIHFHLTKRGEKQIIPIKVINESKINH